MFKTYLDSDKIAEYKQTYITDDPGFGYVNGEGLPAGSVLRLLPGESVTLPVKLYHSFRAEEGSERFL